MTALPTTARVRRYGIRRSTTALTLTALLAGPALTACSGTGPQAAPAGHTTVVLTPARPLDDDQLRQAADLLAARAGKAGLRDVRTEVTAGTVTLSAAGHVGDRLAPLGRRAAVELRQVLAAAPVGTSGADGGPGALLMGTVPVDLLQQFDALSCPGTASPDDPRPLASASTPTVACGHEAEQGTRYRFALAPVAVPGTDIADARSAFDKQSGSGWQVQLTFNSSGTDAFARSTEQLAAEQAPANQFAIVLDGEVLSHPYVAGTITGGQAVISGTFTQDQAETLAASLATGMLPVAFSPSTPQETDS